MGVRALSFGSVAEAYERYRPGYPTELLELVVAYAGAPIRTALEIGAGTGKATRLFVQGGIAVTATEPDAAMLAELRKHLPNVTTVQAAFEDLPLDSAYDLVYSAAALHWTNPDGRWDRMAALVRPVVSSHRSVCRSSWPPRTSRRQYARPVPRSSTTTASHHPTARPRITRCSGPAPNSSSPNGSPTSGRR